MSTDTPSIQDDPTWTTGDVSLISSDRVRIKISSKVLAVASNVFADMLSLPNGPPHSEKTIELSDPNFEDAAKIRTCLTLVTSLGLDFDLKNGKSVGCLLWKDPLLKVMSFVVKYDFAGALTLLKMAGTQAYVDGKFKYRLDAFAFGALTGNVGLCKTVVSTDEVPWGNSTGSAFGFSPGSKLLSAMPPNVVMAIRPQIKFAILRAGNHAEPGTHKFGKYFEAILTAVLTANGVDLQPTEGYLSSHIGSPPS